jgi:hypothetical protein
MQIFEVLSSRRILPALKAAYQKNQKSEIVTQKSINPMHLTATARSQFTIPRNGLIDC